MQESEVGSKGDEVIKEDGGELEYDIEEAATKELIAAIPPLQHDNHDKQHYQR